jgi:prevent-host-death family protein
MREIGVLEAKTQLSALLAEVERTGEPILITRHGRPVARLSPEMARRSAWGVEEMEAHFRWRDEVARDAQARDAQPFDWKDAVEEGRK